MSNVARLKKQAAEFEQKRQLDKALAKYIQILSALGDSVEEADIALYNRVGDMLMRQGQTAQALDYYERAVELYSDGGFLNNAIALCNKILRSAPARTSIYYKLGKASARKGFIPDAKQNYLEYADRVQRSGQPDEALRALAELADLCPDLDDIRLMLADELARTDRKPEAVGQLQTLYGKLLAEGRTSEARATEERMRAIDPAAVPRASDVRPTPRSRDLIFIDVSYDGPASAATVAAPAPAHTPPSPPLALDVLAELPLLELDGNDMSGESAGADHQPQEDARALEGLTHGASLSLGAPEAAELLHPSVLDGLEQSALEIQGEYDPHAPLDGLEPTTVEASPLTGDLPTLDAGDLEDAHGPVHELRGAVEMGPDLGEDDPASHPDALAGDMLLEWGDGELPALDMGAEPGHVFSAPAPVDADAAPAFTIQLEQTGSLAAADPSDGASTPSLRISRGTVEVNLDDVEGLDDVSLPTPLGEHDEPLGVDAPLLDDASRAGESGMETPAVRGLPLLDMGDGLDDAIAALGTAAETRRDELPAAELRHAPQARAEHEPERASVVLSSGVAAAPSDWQLRRQLGEALIEEGDRAAGAAALETAIAGMVGDHDFSGAASVLEVLLRTEPNSVRLHQQRVELTFRSGDRARLVDAYLSLADCLVRDGDIAKARAVYGRVLDLAPTDRRALELLATCGGEAVGSTPAAPRVAEAPVQQVPGARAPEPPRADTSGESFVNLADWLEDAQPERSTRMVADVDESQGEAQVEFAEMLTLFKQGVAANLEETDHDSHYDLGVAYKEMGLLDEAIAEFQKALRGTDHRVRTYEALGQCFVEKRQYQVATTILSRALSDTRHADDVLVGVLYLLGVASEALGRREEAMGYYERVFALDIEFRDVTARLAAVERHAR